MTSVYIKTAVETLCIKYDLTLLAGDEKDNHVNHGSFFEKFTPLWWPLIRQGRYKDAEKVWAEALKIAYVYEAEHKNSIHKGTPYYFWGGTCILSGDLDMGFHLMHQALEEDKDFSRACAHEETDKDHYKKKPAYFFVKMGNTQKDQFFLGEVQGAADFVIDKLRCYKDKQSGMLDIGGLRLKVLENDGLGDVPFFLVYNFFRLKKLLDAKKEIRQNDFASLLQVQTVLGFCIVAEELLKKAYGKTTWPCYLDKFASQNSLPNLTQDNAANITGEFNNDFKKTLNNLLDSSYTYKNGTRPSDIEVDLLILYGIRNTSAHNLNSEKLIYEKFEEISQRILNALFFIIERS